MNEIWYSRCHLNGCRWIYSEYQILYNHLFVGLPPEETILREFLVLLKHPLTEKSWRNVSSVPHMESHFITRFKSSTTQWWVIRRERADVQCFLTITVFHMSVIIESGLLDIYFNTAMHIRVIVDIYVCVYTSASVTTSNNDFRFRFSFYGNCLDHMFIYN